MGDCGWATDVWGLAAGRARRCRWWWRWRAGAGGGAGATRPNGVKGSAHLNARQVKPAKAGFPELTQNEIHVNRAAIAEANTLDQAVYARATLEFERRVRVFDAAASVYCAPPEAVIDEAHRIIEVGTPISGPAPQHSPRFKVKALPPGSALTMNRPAAAGLIRS